MYMKHTEYFLNITKLNLSYYSSQNLISFYLSWCLITSKRHTFTVYQPLNHLSFKAFNGKFPNKDHTYLIINVNNIIM